MLTTTKKHKGIKFQAKFVKDDLSGILSSDVVGVWFEDGKKKKWIKFEVVGSGNVYDIERGTGRVVGKLWVPYDYYLAMRSLALAHYLISQEMKFDIVNREIYSFLSPNRKEILKKNFKPKPLGDGFTKNRFTLDFWQDIEISVDDWDRIVRFKGSRKVDRILHNLRRKQLRLAVTANQQDHMEVEGQLSMLNTDSKDSI